MSTTTDAERSLINHGECLEPDQVRDREPAGYTFAAALAETGPSRNEDIPFVAAALIIAACLTVGATTAAFVFHDRLVQISATLASR